MHAASGATGLERAQIQRCGGRDGGGLSHRESEFQNAPNVTHLNARCHVGRLFNRFIGQTDIVFGDRYSTRLGAGEILQLCLLNSLIERIVREFVEYRRHPP